MDTIVRYARTLVIALIPSLPSVGQVPAAPLVESAKRSEYDVRVAKTPAGDVDARYALARWCKDKKLHTEMRREARSIVARRPNHAGARELLGQYEVNGQWVSRAEAMKARGFVRYRGQWMRKYDVVKLKHEAEQKRAQRKLQSDLNRHFKRLVSSKSKTRKKALAALEDVAARREWPALRDLAQRYHAAAESHWAQQRVVLATVRAQHSELLGIDNFSTSLGTGLPVTLQLPRLRTISVNTTVGIPAGR